MPTARFRSSTEVAGPSPNRQVQIEEKDGEYHLSAVTQGEVLDRDRHQERVDAKAVTLHRFQLEKRTTVGQL